MIVALGFRSSLSCRRPAVAGPLFPVTWFFCLRVSVVKSLTGRAQ